MIAEPTHRMTLPRIAVVATLAAFMAVQALALFSTGGVFEYPLDDVYIHLSMAEQIAHGGYGINAGEYASAASSPLYPFLLVPFAGTEAQRLLPLAWNTLGMLVAAYLWGRALVQVGYGRQRLGVALAVLGPLSVNIYGLAYTGMEHSLHLVASLALLSGLISFIQTGRVGALLVLGVFFGPAFRLEALALSLLAALIVALMGQMKRGVLLGLLALLPAAAFVVFLTSLGLEALPNSVTAKLALPISDEPGIALRIAARILFNLREPVGVVMLLMSVLAMLSARAFGAMGGMGSRLLAYALGIAGIAHLSLGIVGWLNRYEVYVLATMALGLACLLQLADPGGRKRQAIGLSLAALMAVSAVHYLRDAIKYGNWAARGIYLQQTQMARFAQDFVKAPVAVNDIGRVAWQNPAYVLDLWGLASDAARAARQRGTDPHWAGGLAREANASLAMIYDPWVGDYIGEDWQRLGTLELAIPKGFLGGTVVTFYATDPARAPELRAALHAYVPTLPEGALFKFGEVSP